MIDSRMLEAITNHLTQVYGAAQAAQISRQLQPKLEAFATAHPQLQNAPAPDERLTADDVILITYGDQVQEPGKAPLHSLGETLDTLFQRITSGVHILPFYPYTSDDGFSVVDYRAVDPALGSWDDVHALAQHYRLMFDAVINHISASSAWFQDFLHGVPGAAERFIILDPATDVSLVTRPRTHPLLTRFETPQGAQYVWTTFSEDQIDINFANPEVLLAIIDVLLLYVAEGASLIRLDAIGYLWKELGTRCIHLPQTHQVVQLFRSVLDAVAPGVLLITETNVPHADNISYFGDGENEAQLVYQFPLAPLTLNAFHRGNARHLTAWAKTLDLPSDRTTFFNFLASHDGIGVVPASGILSSAEVQELCDKTLAHGGRVSYKTNSDGSQSPYELNITFFDALSDPQAADPLAIDRFVAAQAIMLALQGVPGIYVHSLVGSHNWQAGFAETGRNRTLNREKWQRAELTQRMSDPDSHESQVFARIAQLIRVRRATAAFHPNGSQRILELDERMFAFLRRSPDEQETLLCLHNTSGESLRLTLQVPQISFRSATDLLSGASFHLADEATIAPNQVLWLRLS